MAGGVAGWLEGRLGGYRRTSGEKKRKKISGRREGWAILFFFAASEREGEFMLVEIGSTVGIITVELRIRTCWWVEVPADQILIPSLC